MTTIAIVGTYQVMVDELERALPQDRFVRVDRGGPVDAAADAEVAVGWAGPDVLRSLFQVAPRLRWVHVTSAGVDRLLVPEITTRPDFVLTNNSGSYDASIGEFVIATMFAAAKHLPEHQRAQLERRWEKEVVHLELREATLVVFGLGSIGGEVARLASALGMRVIGVRRRPDGAAVPGVERVVGPERLADVAPDADFLAVTAPLTPSTHGAISADVIARMKRSAWIVNIARGAIVDEAALLGALKEKRIGGAAIDAWWTEPLPPESEWWTLPNVIATPHISYSSARVRERTLALFLENLRRWKDHRSLLNVVDMEAGY